MAEKNWPSPEEHVAILVAAILGNQDSGEKMARIILDIVRPAIYREAADYLYENEATCDQCGNAADEILLSRAKEMQKGNDDD